jgi:hypothetical protein
MNNVKEVLPQILDLDIHEVEILFRHLDKVCELWNQGADKHDDEILRHLVDIVRFSEVSRGLLYEAGYNNLSFEIDHIGHHAGYAILNEGKRRAIGGFINRACRKITQNPQWFKPHQRRVS